MSWEVKSSSSFCFCSMSVNKDRVLLILMAMLLLVFEKATLTCPASFLLVSYFWRSDKNNSLITGELGDAADKEKYQVKKSCLVYSVENLLCRQIGDCPLQMAEISLVF